MKLNPNNIRITISWQNVFPIMKACSGIFVVEYLIHTNNFNNFNVFDVLVKGKVIKKPRKRSYNEVVSNKEFNNHDFEKYIEPTLDTMVESYYNGMLLNNEDFIWIK